MKKYDIEMDIETLLRNLKRIHPDFKLISVDKVKIGEWSRWKCRYGCKAFGKHLNCPPYVPSPEETRRLIMCYERAIVARFDAKPNKGVPPSHIHHFLWDAIKEFYERCMNWNGMLSYQAITKHLQWLGFAAHIALSAYQSKSR